MAEAFSSTSAQAAPSVSSPSQSASSPTETNSSLSKSGHDQLSEFEEQQLPGEKSKSGCNTNLPRTIQTRASEIGSSKPKNNTPLQEKNVRHTTQDSPETIDDDDLSATGGIGFNPTRDNLTDGLVGLLRPSLEALDKGVCNTRDAQNELKDRINSLEQQLLAIEAEQSCPVDLESYINKLNNSKKRILIVNTILQGAQDRLNKVHQNCLKETAKRRTLLEPTPANTSNPYDSSTAADVRQSSSNAGSLNKSLAFQ